MENTEDFGRDTPREDFAKEFQELLRDFQLNRDYLAEVASDTLNVDGRDVRIYGDLNDLASHHHMQGINDYGFKGTCGLVSCEDIMEQYGYETSENDMVRFAVENDLCQLNQDVRQAGGTTVFDQRDILRRHDLPAHVELVNDLENLADFIEGNQGLILEVNAGLLWNDSAYYDFGQPNHAISLIGYQRDMATGLIEGFYINDSAQPQAGQFILADTMYEAFVKAGGMCVVCDLSR